MRREWLLAGVITLAVLGLAVAALRLFAPGLLTGGRAFELVGVDTRLPPFYEAVLRASDLASDEFMLPDPLTHARARPLYPDNRGSGPHDLLGFRNYGVPNRADVIAIGDSQTYGNNAVLEHNWPSRLRHYLAGKSASVYAMATGGWGAVQYAYMARNATVLRPRVLVVAFYSGNDALESFQLAYGSDHWAMLRPDPTLGPGDAPVVVYPPPPEALWPVTFADGSHTEFSPRHRLVANDDHPAVRAGWAIMAAAGRHIGKIAADAGAAVVFTIIPTKELVYKPRLAADGIEPTADYRALVTAEAGHIESLAGELSAVPGARYVDLVGPLQTAVLSTPALYPASPNGHPLAAGYDVIAAALAPAVRVRLPEPPRGLVAVRIRPDQQELVLATAHGAWGFKNLDLVRANGWAPETARPVSLRDMAGLPNLGIIDVVDPARFGPEASPGPAFSTGSAAHER